jgi:hypothetical protein
MKKVYRHIILITLTAALVILGNSIALAVETGTSTMTLSTNTSYGAPGAVYLPDENAYLITRVEGRNGCANNQQIVAQKIDAITGDKIGSEVVLTKFDDICGTDKKLIQNFDIIYNEPSDELLLVYQKSTGSVFLDHILIARRFSASNLSPSDSEVEVGPISSGFYLNIFIIYHQLSSSYYIGYEKKVGTQNNQVFIKNLDTNSNSLTGIELILEKSDFNVANNFGPSKSKIIRNSLLNEFLMVLELQHDNGSDIYGLRLNNSLEVIGDEFQISDSGSNNEFYKSSNIAFNSEKNQFAIIYEKHSDGNEEIAENIFAQIISANNYNVILSNQKEISNIPCSGCFEFSKHPEIVYSPFKNQFVTAFFASPTFDYANDRFNVYVQNLSDDNLNLLTTSNNSISVGSGTTINNYSGLPKLGTAYNHKNNQFLISWLDDNTQTISYQIRRYINNNPSSLEISASEIAENVALGTPIGNLSAYDPDPEDTFTFSLVAGDGSTHNNDFQLNGTQLEVKNSPNFEITNQKSIRLRTTDSKSGTLEKIITIDIADVNDAPTGILSSSNSLDENLDNNTTVASLTANDEDNSDQHSFALVPGAGDDDNDLFSISGNNLISSSPLNYEEKNQVSIRVRTTDQGGLSSQQILTFDVNDINDRPTDINIANNTLEENTLAGTLAGNLYPVDEDLNDAHSFSIIPVAGKDDHQFFEISGSTILNTVPLNFEQKSLYSIKVLLEDQGGETVEKTFEISVLDRNDAPNGLANDTIYYAENNSPSNNIALLEADDEDNDDSHIFSKLSSSPDDIAFYFLGDNRTLKTDSVFNYEQKDHYQIYVEINDGNLTTTDTLNIVITDANDQPQKVYLDQYSFPELNQAGLAVANIIVEDEDITDTYSFELIQGQNDFVIVEGILKTRRIFVADHWRQ